MKVRQRVNYGAIQKVWELHNAIFYSIGPCHTF